MHMSSDDLIKCVRPTLKCFVFAKVTMVAQMSIRLVKAFKVTEEEHADAFERFANGFLVDDYPEIKALGGKKDKGMDAYIYDDQTGNVELVVQSCVSPASRARTKVLDTIRKLEKSNLLPEIFIYCTSAEIGTELDETKKELRRDFKVTLEVYDAAWFVSRHQTSQNRAALCDSYATQTLEPFIQGLQPDKLYSLVLGETQQRIAIQYLEAVSLDRLRGGNLTKSIFDALITCVTRDSDPPTKAYSEESIVAVITAMFPEGHSARIREIVPGRIQHLVKKKALHFDAQAGGYVLSFQFRQRVTENIQNAQERELAFLATLNTAVKQAGENLEVDYAFSAEKVVEIGHQAVLWYLREQGKIVSDPAAALLNILNSEKLVEEFLKLHPLPNPTKRAPLTTVQVMDLLPTALFATLASKDEEVRKYLRGKADLFILHGFLQVTPDVQEACRRLLGGDVLYLDTTILIRCIAEHYSLGNRKPLLDTLEGAKRLGYQLRTWTPYIGELVSHLRNRVQQEWVNHYQSRRPEELAILLRTARTLIRVFCESAKAEGKSLPDIVDEIVGINNHQENAIEYLKEVFDVKTEDLPVLDGDDETDRSRAHDAWKKLKRRPENIQEERFQILVNNDVNSYVSIIRLRRTQKPEGPNYGHKIWYLSLDRMPWRIARKMSPQRDTKYEVAMSFSYLMNYVATLAIAGEANIPEELIPATTILDEAELVPAEIRATYEKNLIPNEKPFLALRKVRELTHQLKAAIPSQVEPIDLEVEIDPDEEDT